jgi:hypothetical protein
LQSLSVEHVVATGIFGSMLPGFIVPPVVGVDGVEVVVVGGVGVLVGVLGGVGVAGGGGEGGVAVDGGGGGAGGGGGGGGGGGAAPGLPLPEAVPPIWARATQAPSAKRQTAMKGTRIFVSNMARSIARLSPKKRRSSGQTLSLSTETPCTVSLKAACAPAARHWRSPKPNSGSWPARRSWG